LTNGSANSSQEVRRLLRQKKEKCLHVDEEQDDQLVCKIGSEKKRKIQKPSQFVPTEELPPPSKVCPRTAKRRQIEKLYTLDEVIR